MTEADLQVQVADYLRLRYPRALFHSDFGSGIKLTMGQAAKQKRQNGGRRAWPDLFIAYPVPRCVAGSWNHEYHGLMIELKKEGTRLRKRNGDWASDHIAEQAAVLERLEDAGYHAVFAVGFDEARKVIDDYLKVGYD